MREKRPYDKAEDFINSLEGLKRASPPDFVFSKLQTRIKSGKGRVISLPAVSVAAAGILLLVALNVMALSRNKKVRTTSDPIQEVVNYYGLTDNTMGV